jgi:hypothetical protein
MIWAIFGPPMFPYCSLDFNPRGGYESRHLHGQMDEPTPPRRCRNCGKRLLE